MEANFLPRGFHAEAERQGVEERAGIEVHWASLRSSCSELSQLQSSREGGHVLLSGWKCFEMSVASFDSESVVELIRTITTRVVPLVFGIIVVVGIVGNALVIAVVSVNRQMRNTTNVLIVNLALADLMFIVLCVPFTATDYAMDLWPFGLLWCQSVQYLIYVTSFVSIYTLILMALDRFMAVVLPVVSLPYRTVGNACWATAITWLLSALLLSPVWFAHHLEEQPRRSKNNTLDNDNETMTTTVTYWCRFADDDYSLSAFHVIFFVFGYAIPFLLIVLMYVHMLRRLWTPPTGHNASKDGLRNKRRVTRLVLVVIVLFGVCWAPIHTVLMLKAIGKYRTEGPEDVVRIIGQILAHVLAYINSCVNPIVYAFLSTNFRRAFNQLLKGVNNAPNHRQEPLLHYELTTLREASVGTLNTSKSRMTRRRCRGSQTPRCRPRRAGEAREQRQGGRSQVKQGEVSEEVCKVSHIEMDDLSNKSSKVSPPPSRNLELHKGPLPPCDDEVIVVVKEDDNEHDSRDFVKEGVLCTSL